jgi:hypothetical protein
MPREMTRKARKGLNFSQVIRRMSRRMPANKMMNDMSGY